MGKFRRPRANVMQAIRKWVGKPKRTDTRLLAQFYYADEELIKITQELDSFDGRSEPDRCSLLIGELKQAQEKVIGLIEEIKNVVAPDANTSAREFRVKFPDEVLQDNLAGQLWFGAECLCAGSTIVNREQESIQMRPLARQVVKSLSKLRAALREQALRNLNVYPSSIREALISFDELFAQFEFDYVSILSRVRTVDDHDKLQDISVLLCETVTRALDKKLLRQEMLEDYDPALMITIPRLAIICGVLVYSDGPLDLAKGPDALPLMFKPFYKLLRKIRDLLLTLSDDELFILEKTLCSEENFDEVVLAADAILSSNKYCGGKQKDVPRRRYGSVFPDIFPLPPTDERELSFIEESIREITNKIEPGEPERRSTVPLASGATITTRGNTGGAFSSPYQPPNLTIITEVEVHNSFHEDQNSSHRPSSSSTDSSPNSTLHKPMNSDIILPGSLLEQPNLLETHSNDASGESTPVASSDESLVYPPYDPPPPYSAPEDGYTSSNEDDHGSGHNVSRDFVSHASDVWDDFASGAATPLDSKHRVQVVTCNNNACSPNNVSLATSDGNTAAGEDVLLNSVATTCPDVQPRLVAGADDDGNTSANSTLNRSSVSENTPRHSTSSSSTLYLYRDSSSDTESEGLIPQKLHLLRGKFHSTRDLIHTLFVCISGVADQLQSNYASDLRQTLKSVFVSMSASGDRSMDDPKCDITKGWLTSKQHFAFKLHEEPPPWTDDVECVCCSYCSACFSFFRRRHHCRLCGKIFCSSCASNFVPLPRIGLLQPVRVCTTCIETALDRLV